MKLKIGLDIKYNILNNKDITLLTSILVLFFRELPEPLIDSSLKEELKKCVGHETNEEVIKLTRFYYFYLDNI